MSIGLRSLRNSPSGESALSPPELIESFVESQETLLDLLPLLPEGIVGQRRAQRMRAYVDGLQLLGHSAVAPSGIPAAQLPLRSGVSIRSRIPSSRPSP